MISSRLPGGERMMMIVSNNLLCVSSNNMLNQNMQIHPAGNAESVKIMPKLQMGFKWQGVLHSRHLWVWPSCLQLHVSNK